MSIADSRLMRIAALVLLAAAMGACGQRGQETPLLRAHQLGEQYRWGEAMPFAKAHLTAHPGDPAGHYLLGRCYLHAPQPYLVMAEGELRTALHGFQRTRSVGGLAPYMSPAQFEAAIYRELARTDLRRAHEAITLNFAPAFIRMHLQRAFDAVQTGRAINPEDAILREMEETLSALLQERP